MKRPTRPQLCLLGLLACAATAAETGEARPELVPQLGHASRIHAVAFSPDGETVASCSDDAVILWDRRTAEVRRVLAGHSLSVTQVAFSPDGRLVASAGLDRQVLLWDPATGRQRRTLEGHRDGVTALAFSPDGRQLASGGIDQAVMVWNLANGLPRRRLLGHRGRIASIAWSPDSQTLATGSFDRSARVWSLAEPAAEPTVLTGHRAAVTSVAFAPDGAALATAGSDGFILLWNPANSQQVRAVDLGGQPAYQVSYSPDGKLLLATARGGAEDGSDSQVRLWEAATGNLLRRHDRRDGAVFSPDGATIAAGGPGHTIHLWQTTTGEPQAVLQARTKLLRALAVSPDGARLAAGGDGDGVVVWDLTTGGPARLLAGAGEQVAALAFAPDGDALVAGSLSPAQVTVWSYPEGAVQHQLPNHTMATWLPDGQLLAMPAGGATAHLLNPADGERRASLAGRTAPLTRVAVSPDSRHVAWGSFDGTITLIDRQGEPALRLRQAHQGMVRQVAFSPDGAVLASGGDDGEISFWQVATGTRRSTLSNGGRAVLALAFSADGKHLASGGDDRLVKIWRLGNGGQPEVLGSHHRAVSAVAFCRGGRLASASFDGAVKIWEPQRGNLLLATCYSLDAGLDWLTVLPGGQYAGSPRGAELLRWRLGDELHAPARFAATFQRPDLVAAALRGEAGPATLPGLSIENRPPEVRFLRPSDGAVATDDWVEVQVEASDDKGIRDFELRLNGRPVYAASSNSQQAGNANVTYQFAVPLPPGDQEVWLTALARDDEQFESAPARVRLKRAGRQPDGVRPQAGTLRLLAVGVSEYRHAPESNLSFADDDARAVTEVFQRQQGRLFKEVDATCLVDSAATREAVVAALEGLAGRVQAEDTVLLFLAGHGVRDTAHQYYFAAHDTNAEELATTALATSDLGRLLKGLSARRVMAFLDTCHAGGALGAQAVGVDQWSAELMQKAGVVVLASSTGGQVSLEHPDWGHGAFTKAILEGLAGQADLVADGVITIGELELFVADRVATLTAGRQTPRIPLKVDLDPASPVAWRP